MVILLAPHNDDEALFCAFTIQRVKPLVIIVTDSYKQKWTTAEERRQESIEAMKVLNAPVVFLGIPDTKLNEDNLTESLSLFEPNQVYAPTVYPNGNKDHNIVGSVAEKLWRDELTKYTTYRLPRDLSPIGSLAVIPTTEELRLKDLALSKYKSQHEKSKCHFDAVKGKPEYYD